MKKYILSFVLLVFTMGLMAQTTSGQYKVGDQFKIGQPNTSSYKHIDLPRANIIIKRGGLANYKNLEGMTVEIVKVNKKKDGTLSVKLKRKDGGRFFGSHNTIAASIDMALSSGELLAY